MFKTVVKQKENGTFMAYKCITHEDEVLWVPDDMGNSNREMIDEFVADGGTITEEDI